jgi:cytochrome c-type biogenesis protein CcmH
MIEAARSRLAAGTGSPEASDRQDTVSETAEPDAVGGSSITVRVSLDASLSGEIAASDTLFVLARAVDGPAMPLAVVRKQADELPLVVTLDDSMAMMPTMNLSSREQVTVVAKVSRSGQAITQSGDLIGEISPVIPGDPNLVNVVISKIAP